MISSYMTAKMPTAEDCGEQKEGKCSLEDILQEEEGEYAFIDKQSLDHASLSQKQFETPVDIPFDFDYSLCCESEQRDLRNLLHSVQIHDRHHRTSCKKKGDFCRFHFPWPKRDKTEIKYVKLKGMRKFELRVLAERNNCWVNNYNGWTLLHHRGNMDIQFICNPQGTAMYCCLYSSKAEAPDQTILSKKMLKVLATKESVQCHTETKKTLYLAALAVYASREVSSQEATWYLLGFPFFREDLSWM